MSSIRLVRPLRGLIPTLVAVMLVACAGQSSSSLDNASRALAELEQASGGRLGVYALDTGSGRTLAWRGDERFGMCSTFKLLLAAVVLQAHERGEIDGRATIAFGQEDLVPHAPVISAKLAEGSHGMSAIELARATQLTSDNVAANLLIRDLGGPEAITARWRAMDDHVTRLDRYEPEMNRVPDGELRDTTTPQAMAETVARLMGDEVLSAAGRDELAGWLVETQTGLKRLRAGFPADWRAGDKTGSAIWAGMANKTNDVAVLWPPGRAPVIVAAYYDADGHHPGGIRAQDEEVLAQVGRIVAEWLAPR